MDAHAATPITGLGRVSLINLVDVTSRVKVERINPISFKLQSQHALAC
jgi:hypothetical protein